jgi:translation elongation factor EF-1alpha
MNGIVEKALEEIQKLPEAEQKAFATWILDELESERRWTELFAKSHSMLEAMADEALAEHRAGKTLPLEIE